MSWEADRSARIQPSARGRPWIAGSSIRRRRRSPQHARPPCRRRRAGIVEEGTGRPNRASCGRGSASAIATSNEPAGPLNLKLAMSVRRGRLKTLLWTLVDVPVRVATRSIPSPTGPVTRRTPSTDVTTVAAPRLARMLRDTHEPPATVRPLRTIRHTPPPLAEATYTHRSDREGPIADARDRTVGSPDQVAKARVTISGAARSMGGPTITRAGVEDAQAKPGRVRGRRNPSPSHALRHTSRGGGSRRRRARSNVPRRIWQGRHTHHPSWTLTLRHAPSGSSSRSVPPDRGDAPVIRDVDDLARGERCETGRRHRLTVAACAVGGLTSPLTRDDGGPLGTCATPCGRTHPSGGSDHSGLTGTPGARGQVTVRCPFAPAKGRAVQDWRTCETTKAQRLLGFRGADDGVRTRELRLGKPRGGAPGMPDGAAYRPRGAGSGVGGAGSSSSRGDECCQLCCHFDTPVCRPRPHGRRGGGRG